MKKKTVSSAKGALPSLDCKHMSRVSQQEAVVLSELVQNNFSRSYGVESKVYVPSFSLKLMCSTPFLVAALFPAQSYAAESQAVNIGGFTSSSPSSSFSYTAGDNAGTLTESGKNGKNGHIGVLFVPPKKGGNGGSTDTAITITSVHWDAPTNTATLTYSDNSKAVFTPNSGNTAYTEVLTSSSGDKQTMHIDGTLAPADTVASDGSVSALTLSLHGATQINSVGLADSSSISPNDMGTSIFGSDGTVKNIQTNADYSKVVITYDDGTQRIYDQVFTPSADGTTPPQAAVDENGLYQYNVTVVGADNQQSSGGTVSATFASNNGTGTLPTDGSLGDVTQGLTAQVTQSATGDQTFSISQGDQLDGGASGVAVPSNTSLTYKPSSPTATINATQGESGVLAISQGGDGGKGGTYYVGGKGAKGGVGGNAGSVAATADGIINISGNGSAVYGVGAESIGGDGGNGGGSYTIVGSGGNGGAGGSGGAAQVAFGGNAASSITTTGDNAVGVAGLSIGGNGGLGGSAGGIAAFGGNGSAGGNGGNVSVTINNYTTPDHALVPTTITTSGNSADAVLAQSVGGNSAHGGSGDGFVGLGGGGGAGGNAGTVSVTNHGNLTTQASYADGILAQSIGGGGGNGGSSAGVFSIGGHAGGGGTGDDVTITNSGTIVTGLNAKGGDPSSVTGAMGIVGQSIGGGGGNGGFAVSAGPLALSIGGSGGFGGSSGTVSIGSSGALTTYGNASSAIMAQSIGGGGGNGGGAVAISTSISIAMGGSGGEGGNGAGVSVTATNDIATWGMNSSGIIAQSIGGGGGNGGFSAAASVGVAAFSVALGGNGGAGGDASSVNVTMGGNLATHSDEAAAVLAQSIGGGGGNGGFGLAMAGSVTLSGAVAIGGKGSGGGSAQDVTVQVNGLNSDVIQTLGNQSGGIIAQSIGGGGGNGGWAVAATGTVAAFDVGGAIGVSLGGSAGKASTAGHVQITGNTESIITQGAQSTAILAQSIGGGGGNGGTAVAVAGTASLGAAGSIAVAVGGNGGGGGNGGQVDVTSSGALQTTGAQSSGLVAQSIGGGGGNGGTTVAASVALGLGFSGNVSVGLGGSGGSGGNSADVHVHNDGAVHTAGALSSGVVAQSIGGGGGNGGFDLAGGV